MGVNWKSAATLKFLLSVGTTPFAQSCAGDLPSLAGGGGSGEDGRCVWRWWDCGQTHQEGVVWVTWHDRARCGLMRTNTLFTRASGLFTNTNPFLYQWNCAALFPSGRRTTDRERAHTRLSFHCRPGSHPHTGGMRSMSHLATCSLEDGGRSSATCA